MSVFGWTDMIIVSVGEVSKLLFRDGTRVLSQHGETIQRKRLLGEKIKCKGYNQYAMNVDVY